MDRRSFKNLFLFAFLAAYSPRITRCNAEDTFLGVPIPECSEYICGNFSEVYTSHAHCECDDDCVLFGDCCYDVYTKKHDITTVEGLRTYVETYTEESNSTQPLKIHWINVVKDYGRCISKFGFMQDVSYKMISRCPGDILDEDMIENCELTSGENFLTEVPVTYTARGDVHVAFRNIYCAMCHGIRQDQLVPWKVFVNDTCVNDYNRLSLTRRLLSANNIHPACIRARDKPDNTMPFRFVCSPFFNIDCDDELTQKESTTADNDFICNSYILAVSMNMSDIHPKFRNPHCITCDELRQTESDCAHLVPPSNGQVPQFKPESSIGVLFNFHDGFSFQINNNVYVQNEDLCDLNWIFDTVLQTCIEVVCPDTSRYTSTGCVYDESSWNVIQVPTTMDYKYRQLVITFSIKILKSKEPIVIEQIEEMFEAFENAEIDVSVSDSYIQPGEVESENPGMPPQYLNEEPEAISPSTTQLTSTTENPILKESSSMTFQGSDITNTRLTSTTLFLGMGNKTTTTTSPTISAYRTMSTTGSMSNNRDSVSLHSENVDTDAVIAKIEIRLSGELSNELESHILAYEHLFGAMLVSEIEVYNTNVSTECDDESQESVMMTDVIMLNGTFFGIDNVSRILVNIDMTSFKLNFRRGQTSFANLQFCKNKLLNCTMARYKMSSFIFLENGTLIQETSNRVIGKGSYMISGTDVLACIDMSAVTSEMVLRLLSSHAWLLSLVVESVSVVCLLATSIVYCECFGIRTSNRVCVMYLSLTLAIAQGLFLLQFDLRSIGCKVKSIALHFFWLASFFWMLVIGFDYAKTFRVDKTKLRHSSKALGMRYMLFSYGIPFVFVGICVFIDELVPSDLIGYGLGGVCWIGNQSAYRLVFALPVCIMILLNISFFVCTVIGINRAKFTKTSSTSAPKRSFLLIYVKLSVIMGLTWLFGFIAGIVDNTVLWYCHIILNGLQGLDIFVMFVLNKGTLQHLKKYKEKLFAKQLTMPSSNMTNLSSIQVQDKSG